MHLISFLGKGDYEPSNYIFSNKSCYTNYFIRACKEFFNPEKIFIIWTEEAKKKHFEKLKKEIEFEEINIPYGKSEEELYEIFEIIVDNISENSELILDVTHGFRTQPMIMLSIVVYLRLIKSINVVDIVYGAFEAKDENNNTPVFSLKPFLDIIEWTNAADFFVKRNDSTFLREILEEVHSETYKKKHEYKSKNLSKIGNALKKISDSFNLIRPSEICKEIQDLNKIITCAKTDLDKIQTVRPFVKILEKINSVYSNMIFKSDINLFSQEGLHIQKEFIKLYLKTNQYQQAITLSREFFITLFCFKENKNPFNAEDRKYVEEFLGKQIKILKEKGNNYKYGQEIAELWNQLTEIRNDINHAGMKKNEIPAKTAITNIDKICNEVIKLEI